MSFITFHYRVILILIFILFLILELICKNMGLRFAACPFLECRATLRERVRALTFLTKHLRYFHSYLLFKTFCGCTLRLLVNGIARRVTLNNNFLWFIMERLLNRFLHVGVNSMPYRLKVRRIDKCIVHPSAFFFMKINISPFV